MSKEWTDQCTSIKPGDDSYELANKLVKDTGCTQQNDALTQCLKATRKNWALCQVLSFVV